MFKNCVYGKKDWFGVGVILCLCSRQKDSHSKHLAPKDVVPFLSIIIFLPV